METNKKGRQKKFSDKQKHKKISKRSLRESRQTPEVKLLKPPNEDNTFGGLNSGNLSGVQQLFDDQPISTESGYGSESECGSAVCVGDSKGTDLKESQNSLTIPILLDTCLNDKTSKGEKKCKRLEANMTFRKNENYDKKSTSIKQKHNVDDVQKDELQYPIQVTQNDNYSSVQGRESPTKPIENRQNKNERCAKMSDSAIKQKYDCHHKVLNEDVTQRTTLGTVPTELRNKSSSSENVKSNDTLSNHFKDYQMVHANQPSKQSNLAQVNNRSVLKPVINNPNVLFSYNSTTTVLPVTYNNFSKTDLAPNDGRIALQNKATRIATFRFWPKPHIITGEHLANCGFYYLNDRDRVKCVYCNLILRDWELGDDPVTEHRRFSQTCIFERYMASAQQADNIQSDNIQAGLGVSYAVPKYHNYAIEATRLQTFNNWPPEKTQIPTVLARAGFLFLGDKDSVMCFFCGIKLVNWAAGDDPWFEHAKHSSSCTYVVQSKTQKFVEDVRQASRNGLNHLPNKNAESLTSHSRKTTKAPSKDSDIEQYMNTPAVKSVIEIMMQPKELVIKALKRCMAISGGKCPNAETLMDKLFELEDEDTNSANENQSAGNSSSEPEIDGNISSSSPSDEEPPEGAVGGAEINSHAGGLLCAGGSPDFSQRDTIYERDSTLVPADNQMYSATQNQPQLVKIATDSYQKSENNTVKNTVSDSEEDIYSATVDEDNDMADEFNEDLSSLKIENDELQRQRTCKVCLDEPANIVFLPCGHLTCCSTCSPAIRLCPICRALVRGTVRTFMV